MLQDKSHKGPSQRQLRVGEEVRHILSTALLRGDYYNAQLESAGVIVTEVRMSPDLRHAKAYITSLGGKELTLVLEGLADAAPRLRRELGRHLTTKFTPQLMFVADTSFDEAERINTLLKNKRVAQDLSDDKSAGDEDEPSES